MEEMICGWLYNSMGFPFPKVLVLCGGNQSDGWKFEYWGLGSKHFEHQEAVVLVRASVNTLINVIYETHRSLSSQEARSISTDDNPDSRPFCVP